MTSDHVLEMSIFHISSPQRGKGKASQHEEMGMLPYENECFIRLILSLDTLLNVYGPKGGSPMLNATTFAHQCVLM